MSSQIDRPSPRRCLSRRDVIQVGLLSGLASALPRSLDAADRRAPVIRKAIPSTGEKIPVMGLGTNRFGRTPYSDVHDILQRMHELGGTVIDTAAEYGDSEVQIGKALAELGLTERMFIATKLNAPGAGRPPPPGSAPGGSPDGTSAADDSGGRGGPGGPARDSLGGSESFERSLQRLQKVDLLFVHHIESVEPMMPVVMDLKKQRRVRYSGITSIRPSEYPQLLGYLRKYPIDFLQVNYSLGDRSAEAELLPLAQQRKIAVMAAVPLGGGRNPLIKQAAGRRLPAWAAHFGIASWGQFFLKYVVSHPAVTCAIPGSSKLEHLEDNQAAGHGRLPDAAARRRMEEFWAAQS
jgi:aryl-alcohol dehydrogenase-like predicted oxidoreductase